MGDRKRLRLVCAECKRSVFQQIEDCPICGEQLVEWDGSGLIDRNAFRERRDFCKGCEHFGIHERSGHTKEGCGAMDKPCEVEFAWLSKRKDWCPMGRHEELERQATAAATKVQAPLSWHTDITPTADLAIVTFAVGRKAEEIAEYTVPQMQRYADRVGAELVVIRDDQFPAFRIGNKFRLSEIGKLYERTLYIDIDAWVTERTPNLFTLPRGAIYMHLDRSHEDHVDFKFNWIDTEGEMFSTTQGVPLPSSRLMCRNTGVVVFERHHAGIWQAPLRPFVGTHTAEQTWVEMQSLASGFPLVPMPLRYNLQWWMWKKWGKYPAFIHHLAAAPHDERLQWLRQVAPSFQPSVASACK